MGDGLKILHVASEMVPLVKTGGLADVIGALPAALCAHGHDARVAIPGYRSALAAAEKIGLSWGAHTMTIEVAGVDHTVGVGTVIINSVTVYVLACNEVFARDGIYGPSTGQDYDDNARRFSIFCKAALALPGYLGWIPHVVHAHDWQAGLLPALLERGFTHTLPATRSVFTIHNIAYQGVFPGNDMRMTGLDGALFNDFQAEHFGRLNLLKTGIVFADRVTTVSRRYAEEIQHADYAFSMEQVMSGCRYKLSGITNGIDAEAWNPAKDKHLAKTFDSKRLLGKSACKEAVQKELGLSTEGQPCLIAVVSRLVEQKGIDLILDTIEPYILSGRMQLAVLGSGDMHIEYRLNQLQARHPGWVATWFGYNEALAHRLIAGADAFLMPSRTEPCGLTQMYSLRYGTLPIVRYTGGLADTVTDVSTGNGNGFTFGPMDHGHFSSVLDRALGLYEFFPEQWKQAMKRAMTADHGWDQVAQEYIELYRSICIVP